MIFEAMNLVSKNKFVNSLIYKIYIKLPSRSETSIWPAGLLPIAKFIGIKVTKRLLW